MHVEDHTANKTANRRKSEMGLGHKCTENESNASYNKKLSYRIETGRQQCISL